MMMMMRKINPYVIIININIITITITIIIVMFALHVPVYTWWVITSRCPLGTTLQSIMFCEVALVFDCWNPTQSTPLSGCPE